MDFENGATKFGTSLRWLGLSLVCATLAACGTTQGPAPKKHGKEYFSEKEYGVKASPRVATGRNIPKGGGRYMVGDPYQVKGQWYYPKEDFSYNKVGIASWYGSAFHGRLTANGEVYDQMHLSAAHPTFPLPSYARVTNMDNGSSIIVRVNDRGPYHPGRIIDLSDKTADMLDLKSSGTGAVRVQYVGRARMDGHDMPYLMASYSPKGSRFPNVNPEGQIATGVMVASNQSMGDQIQSLGGMNAIHGNAPVPMRAPVRTAAAAPIPAAVPVGTAYAGSTPSAPFNAQPAAFGTLHLPTAAETASTGQFALLPEIGPIPYERPYYSPMASAKNSLASGYQEATTTAVVDIAFDSIMVRNDGLTQESILAAYKRQAQTKKR